MPGIENVGQWRRELIRKALFGSVFYADLDTPIPTLFDPTSGELQPLPPDWVDVGYLTSDGVSFGRAMDSSDVESWQATEPTRSDPISDVSTAVFTMQETNPYSVALYEGIPLSELGDLGDPWQWDKPANAVQPERRFLFISQDGSGADAIYVARLYPRGKVISTEDETHNKESAIQRGVTVQAYRDTALQTAVRTWVDGPGWRKLIGGS